MRWQNSQVFSSVQFSRSVMSDSLRPHGLQHVRLPCPSPTSGACSNSCSSSQRCHSIICHPLSPCFQSFPASGSFLMSQFFASGIRVSASASVLPMNIQDWFPLGWTGWISLLSKGLSRVFSNTTVQKHQFSGAQPSLWSNSHIHTGLLKKLIYNFRWRDKVETEWFSVVQWLNSLCYFPQLEWLGTHLKLSS